MKGRIAAGITAAVLICVVVAVAIGGSVGDPLIAKSYLEGTYSSDLTAALEKKALEETAALYDAAASRLDSVAEEQLSSAKETRSEGNNNYEAMALRTGERLTLTKGDSAVFYSGSAKVESGSLADVTDGKTISAGGALSVGHRYIATAQAVIKLTSAGSLGCAGNGKVSDGSALEFTDVQKTDWFYDAVAFVCEKGYFSGMGDGIFAPNTSMSRAMLATVLYRLSGETAAGKAEFTDVSEGAWYAEAVAWANQNGIVQGMGGGLFLPDEAVTREQMVTMLYRYQGYKKGETGTDKDVLGSFSDGDRVASWAVEGMEWAVAKGLITGRDTGALDPTGTATRAEVATILQRFASAS